MAESVAAKLKAKNAEQRRKALERGVRNGTIKIRQMTAEERRTGVVRPRMKPKRNRRD